MDSPHQVAPGPPGTPPVIPAPPPVRLTFASGGWVIALAGLVMLAFSVRLVLPALEQRGKLRGDGKSLASYGFDLSTCLVPQEQLVPAVAADLIPALSSPRTLPGAQLDAYNQEQRERYHRKFVVSTDRVAGVVVNGEARAYPLNVLCWHEVCNDTLGGTPVCVSFSPLSDSVVAFERANGGQEYAFGVSGLVYNSNLVLYDVQPQHAGESLWSQLGLRAVAGPAAARGAQLKLMPVEVARWADWLARHPETTVVLGEPQFADRYNMNPYGAYLQGEQLKYPAASAPDAGGLAPFSRVLAVQNAGGWRVYPLAMIAARSRAVDGATVREWRVDGLIFHYEGISAAMDPEVAYITEDAPGRAAVPASLSCLWFAWQAQYPDILPAALPPS